MVSMFLFVVAGAALHLGVRSTVPIAVKLIVDVILVAVLLKLLFYFLIQPLNSVRSLKKFCSELEQKGEFSNQMSAAEEVLRQPDRWYGKGLNSDLTDRLLRSAKNDIENIDIDRILPLRAGVKLLVTSFTGLLIAALLIVTAGQQLQGGLLRVVNPVDNESLPPEVSLFLEESFITIAVGESVEVAVLDAGESSSGVECKYRYGGGVWKSIEATFDQSEGVFTRYKCKLPELTEPVEFYFTRDRMNSQTGAVSIAYPPLVNSLSGVVVPPAYPGLPEYELLRMPSFFSVPEMSEMRLTGQSSEDLQDVKVVTSDNLSRAVSFDGQVFTANWKIENQFTYGFELTDSSGTVSEESMPWQVAVIPDQKPSVSLMTLPNDGILPVDNQVLVEINAVDDYGIAGLYLQLSTGDNKWENVQQVRKDSLVIDLSEVMVMPGESIKMRVKAVDNRPSPAGVAFSNVAEFRMPTASELFSLAEDQHEESDQQLKELREQSKISTEELERIERELLKNPEVDWMKRQEIEDVLNRQQMMQQEMTNIADELQQQMDEMVGREMASEELMQKLEKVSELMQQVQSPELKKLQEQLAEAMKELSDEQIKQAVSEAAENQKEMLEKLDRTISLLEQMQREQEMEAMISQLEQMIREQEELSNNPDSEKQSELAEKMDDLAEQMEEALQELQEMDEGEKSPSDKAMEAALEEAMEQLEKGNLQQAMEEASEGSSSEYTETPRRELAALYHIMLEGQQGMQMSMDQFIAVSLRRLAFDILEVSNRQEQILLVTPDDLTDLQLSNLARSQQRLLEATVTMRERLGPLLGTSVALASRLLGMLDDLLDKMADVVSKLSAGQSGSASQSATDALQGCNIIVMELLTSAQQSSGGGGGSMPMPSMGEQLQQMAKQQAGLNGMAQQMLSEQTRAGMQRLQGEQQGLAGQMQELADEKISAEDDLRLLGDLDELAKEMEKIADEIASGNLNEDVLRRQERILSRMLDAKHSVHKRDYSKKRESKTADQRFTDQQNGESVLDDEGAGRERRYNPPADGVPLEYRPLVREYFKSLQKLEEGVK